MEQSTKKKKLNKNQWLHGLTKEQRNKHFIYENYEQKPWTGGKNAESLTEHKLKSQLTVLHSTLFLYLKHS